MQIDLPGWSQLILAIVAIIGTIGAHRLNRRGQVAQTAQQNAANELALRAQGFDEMEALVERLKAEVERVELRAEREAAAQARRCRMALDHLGHALVALEGQVTNEAARRSAEAAQLEADNHQLDDHNAPPAPA